MGWMLDQSGYRQSEARQDRKLRSACEESRIRKAISRGDRQLVNFRHGRYLLVCNRYSRIWWSEAVCDELAAFFDLEPEFPTPDEPVFLLTLTDRSCITSDKCGSDRLSTLIKEFKDTLRPRRASLDYVGMIEPAYYVNVCPGTSYDGKRCISWHAHYLVWGITQADIKALVDRWNKHGVYRPIADGLLGAHASQISPGTLPEVIGYVLKSPANAYRIRKREFVTRDGEIISGFVQRKQELRDSERIRLFSLMKCLYLDQLAVAGGKGSSILNRAKRTALKRYREEELERDRRRRTCRILRNRTH